MGTVSEADVPSPSVDQLLGGVGPADSSHTPPRRELTARVVSSRVSLRTRIVEIFRARELLVFLVRKELKVKYKGSILGLLWSLLNPAVTLFVYYVVFKDFLHNPTPFFAFYLFAGLIVWNLFSTALVGSSSTIVANAGIVKKVSFPREILAFAQVGTSTMFFFFQSIVLIIFFLGFQFVPDWRYLPLIPFALVDLIVFTAALSIFLSAANVYLRDIEHLVAVLLNAWFWGVPIIYSFQQIYHHVWLRYFYLCDPMTVIILAFQRAIYGRPTYVTSGLVPHYSVVNGQIAVKQVMTYTSHIVLVNYSYSFFLLLLGVMLVISIALLLGAMKVFGRIEGNFAEEL